MVYLFLKQIYIRKRNDFLISEAQWRIWSYLDILLCYLWSKAIFSQSNTNRSQEKLQIVRICSELGWKATEDDYRPTGRAPGIRLNGFFCWWWLWSPGNNQNNAANVNNDGDVNENGNNVNNDNNAVRPALLSYGLKLLCRYTKPVPRAKESDSLSNFRENISRRQR